MAVAAPPIEEKTYSFRRGLSERAATHGVVVHHSESPADTTTADDIHAWHRNRMENGVYWSGIGYHFVVLPTGTIQRGRPEFARGAHVGAQGVNDKCIGICVVGSYGDSLPTKAALASLAHLIAWLGDKYDFDPSEPWKVTGHRDWMSTSCPGAALYGALPDIRAAASAILGGADPSAPAPEWAREAMDWMLAEGLYSEARGNDPVTRAELAVVLQRFAKRVP
jgi:N-acetylmuramoyl-L-alanine amidase